MKFCKSILFFLLCLPWVHVHAQTSPTEYLFKKLENNKSLSNSNVQTILKDNTGFVWFGTAHGLNRFDGTRIRTFYSDVIDTTTLSNNSITKIYNGPENNLWIRDINLGFTVYLSDNEIFDRNITTFAQRYGLKSDKVKFVYEDLKGRFWFGHPFEGISVYDPAKHKTTFLTQNSKDANSLGFNNVSSISQGPIGETWIAYQNGAIDVMDDNTFKVLRRYRLESFIDPAISHEVEVFVDSDADAWLYFPDQAYGLVHIDHAHNNITYINDKSSPIKLNNNLVKNLIEYKPGELWIATDHGGINIVDKKRKEVKYLTHDPDVNQSLSANAIFSLYKDDDDIVWIGTHKQGINYYHQGMLRFTHIRRSSSKDSSLPYNDLNAFVEDSQGNLYIGTNGAGLIYHDRQKGTYKKYVHDPNNRNSLAGDVIVELKIDSEGILWIGTYMNGLSRFDGKNFKNYTHDPKDPTSLSDINVWKIYEDQKKRLWIGTLRAGLNLLDKTNDSFIRFPVNDPSLPLNNRYVSSFAEDMDGNLWVGGGYGIDVINFETNYHRYFSALDEKSGLKGNSISDLLLDSKGKMWVTTSQGLNYFDKETNRFVSYDSEGGLASDFLISILEDCDNNFWISSQKGLSYASVERSSKPFNVSFQNFDERDGLQAAFFNKNTALKTSAGEFIFGGPNGYNIFTSGNFDFSPKEIKVLITDFQLFNKPVEIGYRQEGRKILDKSITKTNNITLKHNENIFTLEFSALNLIHTDKLSFRYKLTGFNEDWITLSEPPYRITYTNLDPGSYKLIIQPTTYDGNWNHEEYAMMINISAPFWQTPLAYLLYTIVAVIIMYLGRKKILYQEREKFKRREERREARRIQELDKLKTKFFTNISHEFRTPLTLILAPIEKMFKSNPSEEEARQYMTLQKNAKRLLQLVNQLLDIKNIEKGGLVFNPNEGDIVAFVRETVEAFADLSENKHINLTFESDVSSLSCQFDADKLEKIIFNLLSNAFKFTPNDGEIIVKSTFEEIDGMFGNLYLSFKDTGIGIPKTALNKIFDRYYTSENEEKILNQGSGIGLSLALEFAKIHDGDIKVTSEEGVGSEFTVVLKLPYQQSQIKWTDQKEDQMEAPMEEEEFANSDNGKPLLLLVEDNDEFRNYLSDFLTSDYQVITASNGKEGLEKAFQKLPDLIISDLMMPQMNGVTLCQQIKKDIKTSHIPVILLTARNSEEKHLEGLNSGCNLYITKPFNFGILLSSIRNLLSERERLQKHYRKIISVNSSEHEIESLDDQLIQKAIAIVENHLEEPEFSVEQMSKELGMSRGQLYKKLSSLTAKSPVEFIRLIRLQRAAQLLNKSQLTIAEIAYKVGYNNAKYFSKHFKEAYGVLPSAYAAKKHSIKE